LHNPVMALNSDMQTGRNPSKLTATSKGRFTDVATLVKGGM
jgi:hypothetical protein